MIRLTRLTDYGIVLLTHVASQPAGSIHAARQLASETHLPLPMVGKVLKALARRGIVVSHRGARGGYSLARPPEGITLSEIITSLEGPIAMTDCVATSAADCEHAEHCPAQGHWRKINDVVTRALSTVSLADMASPSPLRPRLVQLERPQAQ